MGAYLTNTDSFSDCELEAVGAIGPDDFAHFCCLHLEEKIMC